MAIFCFIVIGIFGILFGSMDSDFLAAQTPDADVQVDKEAADFFAMVNITAQSYTSFQLTYPSSRFESFNLPTGHAIEFWWSLETRAGPFMGRKVLEIRHIWPQAGGGNLSVLLAVMPPYSEDVAFPDWGLWRDPAYNVDDLAALWENEVENFSYCEWQHGGYGLKTFIGPHNAGSTISQSWDANALNFTVGFDYDYNQTSINAFDVMGQIITFQSPDLGLPGIANTILSAFIALPLWVMTAILALKLAQSIVPLIKGTDD